MTRPPISLRLEQLLARLRRRAAPRHVHIEKGPRHAEPRAAADEGVVETPSGGLGDRERPIALAVAGRELGSIYGEAAILTVSIRFTSQALLFQIKPAVGTAPLHKDLPITAEEKF